MGFSNIRNSSSIQMIGTLPEEVNESSGLQYDEVNGQFISHNDSGSEPILYFHARDGVLQSQKTLSNVANKDWEEITLDNNGHIYLGDFGNNRQNRKDLVIYKVGRDEKVSEIKFKYGNQEKFPSSPPIFDCEAFFWHQDSLYLFTKSWEKDKKLTQLYVVGDQEGTYTLYPKDSLRLPTSVTAADISKDGKSFVLQTYGKAVFFAIENGNVDFSKPLFCRKTRRKQTEAITFTAINELLFTNEQGQIFEMKLSE